MLAALAKKLNSFGSSIQYFIISLISSCFLLLAISLLYGMFGTVNLNYIFMIIDLLSSSYNFGWDFYTIFSLIIISVLIKMGSFPFFYWLPKVYDNSLMFISSYFSTISFLAYFIFIFNFFINSIFLNLNSIDIFFISCLGSVFFGSMGLLYQIKINRFMAYN
ncbi:proton-conducting transporter membrane subunit, partial [Arcobacter sp.]|uniref:proton-conducting transporter transmembrane domain-containing protein n=1 Tax=Arcobacter sp. TaxID=1872629 RepID=UPI003D1018E8